MLFLVFQLDLYAIPWWRAFRGAFPQVSTPAPNEKNRILRKINNSIVYGGRGQSRTIRGPCQDSLVKNQAMFGVSNAMTSTRWHISVFANIFWPKLSEALGYKWVKERLLIKQYIGLYASIEWKGALKVFIYHHMQNLGCSLPKCT